MSERFYYRFSPSFLDDGFKWRRIMSLGEGLLRKTV